MGISRVPGLSTQASALLSDPGRAAQTMACLASLLGLTSACSMLPPYHDSEGPNDDLYFGTASHVPLSGILLHTLRAAIAERRSR